MRANRRHAAAATPPGAQGPITGVHAVFLGASFTAMVLSPAFLVGGLAVQIGADLGLGPGSLGAAVSAFFALTAISTSLLGRVVQRWGTRTSLIRIASVTALSLAGIATARSVLQLTLFLGVAGIANGAVHPAANSLLAQGARTRLGLAMGIKGSAMPAASMGAGITVPLIALTVGWRWGFALALLVTLGLLARVTRLPRGKVRTVRGTAADPTRGLARGPLLAYAATGGLGSAAGVSVGVFLVDSGVTLDAISERDAGMLLAAASLACIVARILFGELVDRHEWLQPHHLAMGAIGLGALGYLMISTGGPVWFVVGAFLGYALGWGWPALVHFAVVDAYRGNAARATGTIMTGFAGGSFLGPLLFGQLAEAHGYPVTWRAIAASSLLAVVAMAVAVRLSSRATAVHSD